MLWETGQFDLYHALVRGSNVPILLSTWLTSHIYLPLIISAGVSSLQHIMSCTKIACVKM